jgi:hypothetical protein
MIRRTNAFGTSAFVGDDPPDGWDALFDSDEDEEASK